MPDRSESVSEATPDQADTEFTEEADKDLGEMDERLEALEDHIGEAKGKAEAADDAGDPAEEVAGDYEDAALDEPIGDDALGFDDPEAEEEDE
jgi:hypothetical protein